MMGRYLPKLRTKHSVSARQRLIDAAYELFTKEGVTKVGIDAILASAGCANASLYDHFASKDHLVVAFLEKREALWTRAWLEVEIMRRGSNPAARLLAAFDALDDWFQRKDFEGCSFVRVLLESTPRTPLHRAASVHLANVRAIFRDLAMEAGLCQSDRFARAWQMLMKGAIVSAWEGNRKAAREAKTAAQLVMDGWRRRRMIRSNPKAEDRKISPEAVPRRRTRRLGQERENASAAFKRSAVPSTRRLETA